MLGYRSLVHSKHAYSNILTFIYLFRQSFPSRYVVHLLLLSDFLSRRSPDFIQLFRGILWCSQVSWETWSLQAVLGRRDRVEGPACPGVLPKSLIPACEASGRYPNQVGVLFIALLHFSFVCDYIFFNITLMVLKVACFHQNI